MKSTIAAGALILVAAFPGAATGSDAAGTAISAAQTKQAHKQNKAKRKPQPPAARAPQSGSFGWRPADPSFDQQGRRYQPPPGLRCPIDLGYGRWASCNDDL